MAMHVEYREYQEEYRSRVEEMVFSLYREDPFGEPIDSDKIAATLAECTLHPDKLRLLLIRKDGETAGYAIVLFLWSNEHGGNVLHIDELYIKEAFRSQGLGSGFVSALPELFPDSAGLSLEVTPTNAQALKLYQRLGFQEIEDAFLRRATK